MTKGQSLASDRMAAEHRFDELDNATKFECEGIRARVFEDGSFTLFDDNDKEMDLNRKQSRALALWMLEMSEEAT